MSWQFSRRPWRTSSGMPTPGTSQSQPIAQMNVCTCMVKDDGIGLPQRIEEGNGFQNMRDRAVSAAWVSGG